MGLESTSFLSGLDGTWPTGIDKVNEGDDHLRLLKNVLKSQFPGIGGSGFAQAITANEMELNYSVGVTSLIQPQLDNNDTEIAQLIIDLDAAELGVNPIGAIIMFNAAFAGIPANWALCDGNNGTPNMVDQFVYGTITEGELLNAGGVADSVVVDHVHILNDPMHAHGLTPPANAATGAQTSKDGADDGSAVPATDMALTNITMDNAGVSGVNQNLPPYIKLAFIQRIT